MQRLEKIGDQELRQYEAAGIIRSGKIISTPAGYVLVITVGTRAIELTVHNYRGSPRTWASLDRMLRYLGEAAPSLKQFTLVIPEQL